MLFTIWKEREKLHNQEPDGLHSSSNKIRVIQLRTRHVAHMGDNRNAYRVSVDNPEGKGSLGRPSRRWEDNMKVILNK
jgi:hypothetical protein